VTTPDTDRDPSDSVLDEADRRTVAALLDGDEQAFEELVRRYHGSLLRLAMTYVRPRSAAEEVVQDTWLGVLRGLPTFEGRSSLRTWIFRIATNIAKTRGVRESRSVPLSSLAGADEEGPTVDPTRFVKEGWWTGPLRSWDADAARIALDEEAMARIQAEIDRLPEVQRAVITLRDVQGLSSEEVCELLDVTPGNQRVILHRARAKVRAALEDYFAAD
jgi:RNA polymerase sigma-70 factor (ECF subfamily)